MHLICVTYIWRLIFQGKDLDIWPPFSLFFLKKPKQQQQQSLAPISIFRYLKLDCKEEQRNRNWCGLPEPATASFFCSHAVYIYDMQEQDDWKACLWVYLCMFALNYNAQEKRSCIALSAEKMLSWVLHWSCFFRNKNSLCMKSMLTGPHNCHCTSLCPCYLLPSLFCTPHILSF